MRRKQCTNDERDKRELTVVQLLIVCRCYKNKYELVVTSTLDVRFVLLLHFLNIFHCCPVKMKS